MDVLWEVKCGDGGGGGGCVGDCGWSNVDVNVEVTLRLC